MRSSVPDRAPPVLYVLDVREPLPPSCRVVAWRPAVPGIAEVFHARIADYRYPRHCHDTWTVLIVDTGALCYDLDTRRHGAVGETVSVLPPGVTHNGYPADHSGSFRKRNLYLDSDFLPEDLVGHAVDASTFQDGALRAAISALHDCLTPPEHPGAPAMPEPPGVPPLVAIAAPDPHGALATPDPLSALATPDPHGALDAPDPHGALAAPDPLGALAAPDPLGALDAEARLALIAERFRHRLQRRPPAVPDPEPAITDQLRQYLDGHVADNVTLHQAARLLGRSVPHLVRSFTKRYSISPHAYVVAKRIEAARSLLLRGVPAAQVATDVGFHDQAHLTRHFKRHVSVTPARYAASAATTGR